jgi:hypothetical protein
MYHGATMARQRQLDNNTCTFWTWVQVSNLHTEYAEYAQELLIQHDSIPDEEITLPVQEGTKHTQILSNFLSDLINERRPDESCI